MAIDIAKEEIVPLVQVPVRVPRQRGGKKLAVSTAFRWAKAGLRGVRLETIQIGGTKCTSVQALQRFFEALSELSYAEPAEERRRAQDVARAGQELDTRWGRRSAGR